MGKQARRLTADEIRLITAMTDQIGAVIENINLFGEVKTKTAELETANLDLVELLERETVVAEMLRAMASSPSNLQSLLDSINERAVTLVHAKAGVIRLLESGVLRFAAHYRNGGSNLQELQNLPQRPDEYSATTRAMRDGRPIQVRDIRNAGRDFRGPVKETSARTVLAVPMIRENAAIGVIVVYRDVVEPFTERQIELVKTFADQAVIAIANVQLFQELQARSRDLAQSVEELRALGEVSQAVSSTLDLQTVLTTIVSHACRHSGAGSGGIFEFQEKNREFLLRATLGVSEELTKRLRMVEFRLARR